MSAICFSMTWAGIQEKFIALWYVKIPQYVMFPQYAMFPRYAMITQYALIPQYAALLKKKDFSINTVVILYVQMLQNVKSNQQQSQRSRCDLPGFPALLNSESRRLKGVSVLSLQEKPTGAALGEQSLTQSPERSWRIALLPVANWNSLHHWT